MVPDNNELMNEREEQALLKEMMPGFDKEMEWEQLSGRLRQVRGRKIQLGWMKIAAAMILLAGGACVAWLLMTNSRPANVAVNAPAIINTDNTDIAVYERGTDINGSPLLDTPRAGEKGINVNIAVKQAAKGTNGTKIATPKRYALARTVKANKAGSEKYFNYYLANEFVCNGTQCPLEICIVQTFNCNNKKPAAVATCNTLNPDEARQLRYKALDKKGKDCKVTIDEIRIKRVSTGETIVLNANSKPSTAEELFSCITGEEKCNILAGIFDEDCTNNCKPHDLTIYNNKGNLILQ